MANFERFGLNFSSCAIREVASLTRHVFSFSSNLTLQLNDQEFPWVFKITVFDPLVADVETRLHDLILTVASSEDHTAVLKSRRCIPRIKLFRRFIKSLDLQMKTLSSNQQEERQFLTAFKAKNKIPRFFSWALNY